MNFKTLIALAALQATAPLLAQAQTTNSVSTSGGAVTGSSSTNLGNGVNTTTECTVGTTATASGGVNGNNAGGSASVGSGVACSNTTGYTDPNGYIQLETSCQSGNYANAAGTAGANGVMFCADASSGTSCSVGVGGGGNSSYGGGGASAGVGAGGSGMGACGGFTFTGGVVSIQYCGALALDIGVDFCLNGNVNYANVVNRMEPFASRAVAQAAKCASNGTAAKDCSFSTADLMANAAGPYYKRSKAFFDSNNRFAVNSATSVWKDANSVKYRSSNYAKSVVQYTGSGLQNTSYNAAGQVVNAANQLVDVGGITLAAAMTAGATTGKGIVNTANTVGSALAGVGKRIGGFGGMINKGKVWSSAGDGVNAVAGGVGNGVNQISNGANNGINQISSGGKSVVNDVGNGAKDTGKKIGKAFGF